MTGLKQELEQLVYIPPLVSNRPGEMPDGNPITYLGVFVYVWSAYNGADPWVKELVIRNYLEALIEQGNISRGKHKSQDNQEHDDFIGMAYAAQQVGEGWIADQIVELGEETFWNYADPVDQSGIMDWLGDWHARFPGLVQHYKLCSTKYQRLSMFDRFWFAVSFLFPSKGGGGDMLDLLRRRAYLNQPFRYWICNKAIQLWERRYRENYPNLTGSLMQLYFDRNEAMTGDPVHVYAKWMQGRI